MDASKLLWLIPVLPLLGAAVNGAIGRRLPVGLAAAAARQLMPAPWFVKKVVLDGWFLRTSEAALHC